MGNFDVFDAFQPDRQNLTRQIFKAIQCLVKGTDHPSKYSRQIFEKSASVKISPHQNFPLYTVCPFIILLLVSLLFIIVINPYLPFKFNFLVLNTSLFTFYATLCSWYDYAWLQHVRT